MTSPRRSCRSGSAPFRRTRNSRQDCSAARAASEQDCMRRIRGTSGSGQSDSCVIGLGGAQGAKPTGGPMAKVNKVKIRTIAERQQAGRSLREKCPRQSHGKVVLGQGKKRDPVALIEASNEDRVENLIPIRHGRMLQSPFAFF